jgi:hypothetical protein
MATFVVRLWLPDRPGALGQVASRIGAVSGDVVGIEILERGGGSAIDDLTVSLPDASLVDLLVAEIRQVDGVAVEDVRAVPADRPDGSMAALSIAATIVKSSKLANVCYDIRGPGAREGPPDGGGGPARSSSSTSATSPRSGSSRPTRSCRT